ncbi:triacylglycerol lipase [Paracoccus isoporae]|uniref:Triacylglycerol lipase n=1 Tax=Paracoccus isoporae TaxID=591205 RepID=A0A1G6SLP6_9RHOB|nr:calcium-binding protein [Paracoccus isoporae]SDD17055.1 triacylglycerol lipase [Paracoccus isoporae]
MGIFDYKGMDSTSSAALVNETLAVSMLGQTLGSGTTPAGAEDWRHVDPADMGIDPAWVDSSGFIKIKSPLTGWAETGPQVTITEKTDAAGNVIGLGVVFLGTNSLIDVLDYFQMNSGELHEYMEPVLALVRDYAQDAGLDGSDVMVTGYSLGGGYTNLMARYADTLADGFFADADYVGHASPLMYEEDDRVLNIGYENDVVFRAVGDHADIQTAIQAADPLLSNPDESYGSSTDNLVMFDDTYARADVMLAVDSILNLAGSWAAHLSGAATTGLTRIAESTYYEFTERDSVVVVSDLSDNLRGRTWVEDKKSPTSDHFGAPSFVVGSDFDDRLGDGAGTDWIDGGTGDDVIRVTTGMNRVDGGEGVDTLRIVGEAEDYQAFRLSGDRLAVISDDSVTIAENVEGVEFATYGKLGALRDLTRYSIQNDRLEDESFSFFGRGDEDLWFGSKTQGHDGNQLLRGNVVFAEGGNDLVMGTMGQDVLLGGEGADRLVGGTGADRLYGNENRDVLVASSDGDRLNGGHGDDVFLFNAGIKGTVTIEDFNAAANEADEIQIIGASVDAMLASAEADGGDTVLRHADLTIRLENVDRDALFDDLLMA